MHHVWAMQDRLDVADQRLDSTVAELRSHSQGELAMETKAALEAEVAALKTCSPAVQPSGQPLQPQQQEPQFPWPAQFASVSSAQQRYCSTVLSRPWFVTCNLSCMAYTYWESKLDKMPQHCRLQRQDATCLDALGPLHKLTYISLSGSPRITAILTILSLSQESSKGHECSTRAGKCRSKQPEQACRRSMKHKTSRAGMSKYMQLCD